MNENLIIQPATISHSIAWGIKQLASIDSARLDSELLLCHSCKINRSQLISQADYALTEAQWELYRAMVTAHADGMPVAYIVGEKEFWSLRFKVTAATLVPRPETETLVECTLRALGDGPKPKILELGTGCGAIALAIASERPDAVIHAIDQSEEALTIAKQNLMSLNFMQVNMWRSDWFNNVGDKDYDMIVSNPPYLARNDPHLAALKFEPQSALVSADQGLADLGFIIRNAGQHMKPTGQLALEHGAEQGSDVAQLMQDCRWQNVTLYKDLSGHHRVTMGQRPL